MAEKKNQAQKIIDFLIKYGSINDDQARQYIGCRRLSARIHDIKKLGYDIKTTIKHGKDRWGESTHYAIYELVVDDDTGDFDNATRLDSAT